MKSKLIHYIFFIPSLILLSIISYSNSLLNFTYPQATTLKNQNILVVEKNGIYICDESYEYILRTVQEFSEEDKILNEDILSKTIIKKSDNFILIFSNYKLYIIDTNDGNLIYYSSNKLIEEDNVEYITLAYIERLTDNNLFLIIIAYLNQNNYLNITNYRFLINDCNIIPFNLIIDKNNDDFYFERKGLSCEGIDPRIFCFSVITKMGKDCIMPLIFEFDINFEFFSLKNDIDIPNFSIDGVKQIKSKFNTYMNNYIVEIVVGFVKDDYTGGYVNFYFDNQEFNGHFDNDIILFDNCKSDTYGMKVTYIFEIMRIVLSCSDREGNIQIYDITEEKYNMTVKGCDKPFGYSVIYITKEKGYFFPSDICQEREKYILKIKNSDNEEPSPVPDTSSINKIISNKISTIFSYNINSYNALTQIFEIKTSFYIDSTIEIICPKEKPFKQINKNECVKNCEINDIIEKQCILDIVNKEN